MSSRVALGLLVVLMLTAVVTEYLAWHDCLTDHSIWFCMRVL